MVTSKRRLLFGSLYRSEIFIEPTSKQMKRSFRSGMLIRIIMSLLKELLTNFHVAFYKYFVPSGTKKIYINPPAFAANLLLCLDATLATAFHQLHPVHQSSDPAPKPSSETPLRRECFRSAQAPSTCVQ